LYKGWAIKRMALKAVIGPGDDLSPVIMIMYSYED